MNKKESFKTIATMDDLKKETEEILRIGMERAKIAYTKDMQKYMKDTRKEIATLFK